MSPAAFDAKALAGSVTCLGGNRARRPGGLIDMNGHIFGAVISNLARRFRRGGSDIEQPRGDERLAQIVQIAAIV